jgi:hypothetical protein
MTTQKPHLTLRNRWQSRYIPINGVETGNNEPSVAERDRLRHSDCLP